MKFFVTRLLLVGILMALSAGSAAPAVTAPPTASVALTSLPVGIYVGPNIFVSHDIDAPHTESHLAADPANPRRLLGGVTTVASLGEDMYDKTWTSSDGGYTWTEATPPGSPHRGGGDPQVAFGPTGTAYFATLLYDHSLHVYRSTDGGLSWQRPKYLGRQDHEQIAVDWTHSEHRGRIYITGENPYHPDVTNSFENMLQLWRSDDDGKTFSGPKIWSASHVGAPPGLAGTMVAAWGLEILNDGRLIAGILRYPSPKDKRSLKDAFLVAVSSDGGNTFSAERKVAEFSFGSGKQVAKRTEATIAGDLTKLSSLPHIAADKSTGAYQNRLYAVWNAPATVPSSATKLYLSHSADLGQTWSAPMLVDQGAAAGDGVEQPAIVVNNRGTLGILFYRAPANRPGTTDVYFTASLDGGQTLLAPQRISSRSSVPRSAGNLMPRGDWKNHSAHDVNTWLSNMFSYQTNGGDYIGLDADANGIFHPFWIDSRSGTFQLYTAPILVGAKPQFESPSGPPQVLDDKVMVVFDQTRCDFKASDCTIPIRLKNLSHDSIVGPLTVMLKSSANVFMENLGAAKQTFAVLNATNGKRGGGASFDYTNALGSWGVLPPDGLTDAVEWRLHFKDIVNLEMQMHFDIRGYIAKKL